MSENQIVINNLSKVYDNGFNALKNINLNIKKGEIFAMLGPNGAGKTTLISIICGIVKPSSGKVTVEDFDIIEDYRETRSRIGLVPQELTLEQFETVFNNVSYSRGLYGKKPDPTHIEKVLKQLSLWDKKDLILRQLSGGMKRRVLIAKALSHEPEILFLDEPTAGVDVELRQEMWRVVETLRETGVTIILTTHYLEEAETLCDEIAIIHKGKIVANDYKRNLLKLIDKKILIMKFEESPNKKLINDLKKFGETKIIKKVCEITFKPTNITIDKILKVTKSHGLTILDLQTKDANLEDVFMSLTKN